MDTYGCSAHVLVNGRKVKEYRHNGLTFVEAKDGTEFSIEIKNHTPARVLAIVSVDGLDVIKGQTATAKSPGFIVNAYSSEVIKGWQKSDTDAAAFQFTHKGNSYATDKGKGENNGVIAVKFIAEKIQPLPFYTTHNSILRGRNSWPTHLPYGYGDQPLSGHSFGGGGTSLRSCLDSNPVAQCSSNVFTAQVMRSDVNQYGKLERIDDATFDMGTTWGSVAESRIKEVEFEYGTEIDTLEFFYASREALKAMGIPLISERLVSGLPQAFPTKYAQPPKNWRA